MTTQEKAYILIGKHGKYWLAEKIGISYNTLINRLEINNWKPGEIMLINNLN